MASVMAVGFSCGGTGLARTGTALAAGVLLGVLARPLARAEGIDASLMAATSNSADVKKLGVTIGVTRAEPLWEGELWRLKLRHEFEAAAWRVPKARDLLEAGYSPVFRFERSVGSGAATLFLEGSIGARLLSHTQVAPDRVLSTAFQFSDVAGLGVRRGQEGQPGSSSLSMRLQHMSNADIKRPNPGINFLQVRYTYQF